MLTVTVRIAVDKDDYLGLCAEAERRRVSAQDLIRGFAAELPRVTPKQPPREVITEWLAEFRVWLKRKRGYTDRSALVTSAIAGGILRHLGLETLDRTEKEMMGAVDGINRAARQKQRTACRRYLEFLASKRLSLKNKERAKKRKDRQHLFEKAKELAAAAPAQTDTPDTIEEL